MQLVCLQIKVCAGRITYLKLSCFLHYRLTVWRHIFAGCSQGRKLTFGNILCTFKYTQNSDIWSLCNDKQCLVWQTMLLQSVWGGGGWSAASSKVISVSSEEATGGRPAWMRGWGWGGGGEWSPPTEKWGNLKDLDIGPAMEWIGHQLLSSCRYPRW